MRALKILFTATVFATCFVGMVCVSALTTSVVHSAIVAIAS